MSSTGTVAGGLAVPDTTPDPAELVRRSETAAARTALLRRIGDIMSAEQGLPSALLRSIVNVMAETLGGIVAVRVFSTDRQRVTTEVVSEPLREADTNDPDLVQAALLWDPGWPPSVLDRLGNRAWSSARAPGWREDLAHSSALPLPDSLLHVVSAPIRADQIVVGYLRCIRTTTTPVTTEFQPADDDLTQIVADRIGSALTVKRLRTRLERAELDGRAAADRLSRLRLEYASVIEQLSTVEERERVLLAEAIHDEPMQLIVAVMMLMDSTPDHQRPAGMDRWIDVLERAVGKLRSLIISMTPADLTDGLGIALRRLAEGIFVGWPMSIEVTGLEQVPLSPARASTAWKIARESLVNVRKHAQASAVRVDLQLIDGQVRLRVADDGVGASDLSSGPGHLGVATMRARAVADGGTLDIVAAPGGGTTVTFRIPASSAPPGDP
ncbi:hypothetical protein FDO65_17710 [Nakamurella flava]|uniref:Histidine kinase/HSP90-like ATPase domain-containing protein n=1 Tax=Nakamurella flava TaxID=2576308 RepID=A0A4U6QBK0_9ACTN|nr:ATP-binding protein [Nakamurella flava]TKV57361.1 hypothetical protein FDO65_17710 [Nakamurella flava]